MIVGAAGGNRPALVPGVTGGGPRRASALASAPMPSNPLSDPNWAPQLADTIERVVGQVRDKTTKPVVMITRGLANTITIRGR